MDDRLIKIFLVILVVAGAISTLPESARGQTDPVPAEIVPKVLTPTALRGPKLGPPATAHVEEPPTTTSDGISLEEIEVRREEAARNEELDEEAKKKIADLYRQATDEFQRTQSLGAKLVEYKGRAEHADERVTSLKMTFEKTEAMVESRNQELSELKRRLEDGTFQTSQSLSELQQQYEAREQGLKKEKEELARHEAATTSRTNRRKDIRTRLATLETEREEVHTQLNASTPSEVPAVALAKRTELLTRQKMLLMETPTLEQELATYDIEDSVDLLRVERDLASQKNALAELDLQIVEMVVKWKRNDAAQNAVKQAKEESRRVYSQWLKPLADRNQELAELNQKLTTDIVNVDAQRKELQMQLDQLKRDFELIKQKVSSVGLPASVGAMLRKQRTTLPNIREHRSLVRQRQPKIDAAQLGLFDLDDERSKLVDPEPLVRTFLLSTDLAQLSEVEQELLGKAARDLFAKRREFLDTLIKSQGNYFDKLADESITEQQLIRLTEELSDYIDERVLWIRSGPPLHVAMMDGGVVDIRSSAIPWIRALRNWGREIVAEPWSYGLTVAMIGVMLRFSHRIRRRIAQIGELVERGSFSQFWPTFKVFVMTALISIPWPLLFLLTGWRLLRLEDLDPVLPLMGRGAICVGWLYLPLEFLRQVCRPSGLAQAHFQWAGSSVTLMRRSLRLFTFSILPIAYLIATLGQQEPVRNRGGWERVLFISGAMVTALFMARMMNPQRGIFYFHLALYPDGWFSRLRRVWYSTVILLPLTLAGLTFWGYYYTAQQLAWRACVSSCLISVFALIFGLLSRLLLVHRRRLSIEQTRMRRGGTTGAGGESSFDGNELLAVTNLTDLRAQTQQAHRLLATGMVILTMISVWFAWVDVLPALGFLDHWPLWETTVSVSKSVTNEAGETITQLREELDPVTVVDVLFAVLLLIVTLVATQNVPGLLEIAILQQLPFDRSMRYALSAIASYTILLVGIVASCSLVGIHWNQVQWIATALTFGLAFGLQEMFANFVAGIIILFERPIRVGDIVTVDQVTGVVSRVQMRATTITNWDRKDFIVPNKDFITGRVLNWTLTDQVNRIVIHVGVSYGSDTELGKQILLKIAESHPIVAKDPPPTATFEEFGASSLDLVLRCFIAIRDMPSRLQVVDELHTSIDREFRRAGIEIAFPQQDLHIRSLPEAWSRSAVPPATDALNEPQIKRKTA